jgi:hypothetical protein
MGLRLETSSALREKRLERLLTERGLRRDDVRLASLVEDALVVGSLALSGHAVAWEEARGANGPAALAALRRARAAVAKDAPVTLAAIRAWHAAIAGSAGFRSTDAPGARDARDARDAGPPAAPVEFIASRLDDLVHWLDAEGSAGLRPEEMAAVALARVVEVRPFADANGRVSRLLAAHVMARAGLPPPILVGGDAERLRAALQAAFRLETAPLVDLVREASGRALDVMSQALERGLVSGP